MLNHSSQLTAHSSQLTAHSSQLTAHSSQLTAHSLGWRKPKSSLSRYFFTTRVHHRACSHPQVSRPAPSKNTIPHVTSRGFTLVELMIVIALLAIFASIAVPSFTSMIANTRTETTASELHSLLVSARSNAITQRTRTTLTLKANKWELTQGSTVSGTLIIPTGVSLTPSSLASLTFQPDGSTSQATLCLSNNRGSKTFTLDVQPSGVIRLSPSASCS